MPYASLGSLCLWWGHQAQECRRQRQPPNGVILLGTFPDYGDSSSSWPKSSARGSRPSWAPVTSSESPPCSLYVSRGLYVQRPLRFTARAYLPVSVSILRESSVLPAAGEPGETVSFSTTSSDSPIATERTGWTSSSFPTTHTISIAQSAMVSDAVARWRRHL